MQQKQLTDPVSIVGGAHRKGVPWHEMRVGDSLTAVSDPYGETLGQAHPDANGVAVYWKNHHIGYFNGNAANILGPLLKQNLIELVLTLAWIDGPTSVQSVVTVKAKAQCAKPSS